MRELQQVLGPGVGVRAGVDEHRRRRAASGSGPRSRDASRPGCGAARAGRRRAWRRCSRPRRPRRPRRRATARHRATSELSGFPRTASAGFSSISMTPCGLRAARGRCVSRPAEPYRMGVEPVAGRLERARDDLLRAAVAPHRVDRDPGHPRPTGRRCGAARPRGPCTSRSSGRRDGAASAARTVGQTFTSRRLDRMRRTPLVAPGAGLSSLRDGHERRPV